MQAETKSEQIDWARAFTILFELRARLVDELRTIESNLNSHAKASITDMAIGDRLLDAASTGFEID